MCLKQYSFMPYFLFDEYVLMYYSSCFVIAYETAL